MTSTIRVSVVAPVYNAEPFLLDFVNSFLKQTLHPLSTELVAVDDGSTDRSGSILDDVALEHENVTVIHQENSGWPGRPRNVGVEAARGDYVFFADPDDEFGGPEALQRLADFADQHSSDVVVPKMVAKGKRSYGQSRYAVTQIDADLTTCFTTLTPQKLFRRSFLIEEGIRFPEGETRLEDGQLLSQAYFLAKRVSLLTGYDFYYLFTRPDQDHLSARPKDPRAYVHAVEIMSENVEKYCSDQDLGDKIINDIYSRKVLHNFSGSRLLRHSEKRRANWLENQQRFIERFINGRRFEKLGAAAKARTELVIAGDPKAIVGYACVGAADFEFDSARSVRGRVELRGKLTGPVRAEDPPELVIVDREVKGHTSNVQLLGEGGQSVAKIAKTVFPRSSSVKRYDLWFSAGQGHQMRRIESPDNALRRTFTDDRTIVIYTTKMGNLSVEVKPGLTIGQRIKRRIRRLVSS